MTNKELRNAAAAGDAEAQYDLGMMYLSGTHGFPKHFAKAYHWFLQSAAQGHTDAQFTLGTLYIFGRDKDIPQDYQQARYWYEKAAAQDHVEAQFLLGVMYEDGTGGPSDWDKALEWYQKACEGGDEKACEAYEELIELMELESQDTETGPEIDV